MSRLDYDAVVVGSGPNGLAAAITLQREGLSVLLLEASSTIGGGMRTAELTLPGFLHDVCSAVHPLAKASPFFRTLPLEEHGLRYIEPEIPAAHSLERGEAVCLRHSIDETALSLREDRDRYLKLFRPLVDEWKDLLPDILGPLRMPRHPLTWARFGLKALLPATSVAHRFKTKAARALFAGMAAHSMQPLTKPTTAAIAMVLATAGHSGGWPISAGGSQSLANALARYFQSLGGAIETNRNVSSMKQLPSSRAVLFDVTPRQLLSIAADELSPAYKRQLQRYRYGVGAFKIDWALSGPVPFTAEDCRRAGTVHLGGTLEEITATEDAVYRGRHPDKPYVLLAQPSVFDPSRAPAGKHVLWGYCHVPHGSNVDRSEAIEQQIERVAPGFRDLILARSTMNTQELQAYNANYIGGDINGGELDLRQLYTRPTVSLSPYRTSIRGIYLCSASTPPGGGVHGMNGYHAARLALHDVFSRKGR
jgi:phytoene dehydrogenase-like protein